MVIKSRNVNQTSNRFVTATAILLLLSGSAFADCKQELDKLEPTVVSAETGATTGQTTATEHQKEVTSGDKSAVGTETTGSTGEAVKAISPHQEEVMGKTKSQANKASQTMMEARKLADAGNEDGCMEKVAELKKLVGD